MRAMWLGVPGGGAVRPTSLASLLAERGLAEMQADVDKLRAQVAADGKY